MHCSEILNKWWQNGGNPANGSVHLAEKWVKIRIYREMTRILQLKKFRCVSASSIIQVLYRKERYDGNTTLRNSRSAQPQSHDRLRFIQGISNISCRILARQAQPNLSGAENLGGRWSDYLPDGNHWHGAGKKGLFHYRSRKNRIFAVGAKQEQNQAPAQGRIQAAAVFLGQPAQAGANSAAHRPAAAARAMAAAAARRFIQI